MNALASYKYLLSLRNARYVECLQVVDDYLDLLESEKAK